MRPWTLRCIKGEDGDGVKRLAGAQHRAGEVRMVRRVGEALCLQAQASPTHIRHPTLADDRPIQVVAGVELHAWRSGADLQDAPAGWVIEARRWAQFARRPVGEWSSKSDLI